MYMGLKVLERGELPGDDSDDYPRPVAWVLSENETGNYNLAPVLLLRCCIRAIRRWLCSP